MLFRPVRPAHETGKHGDRAAGRLMGVDCRGRIDRSGDRRLL